MNHSTGKPTSYEQERIEAMLKLGCICCGSSPLNLWAPAEVHHIVEGHRRLGHWYTLPLCPGHHRGVWNQYTIRAIAPSHRVSIASGSKVFTPIFGTERELFERVQTRLGLSLAWPDSKRVPRKIA